jgi:spore coat protein SA
MKIRHVLPQPEMGVLPLDPLSSPVSGICNSVLQLATQQVADGHQVEIFCPTEGRQQHQRTVAGIQVHWLPLWERFRVPRYDLRYYLPLLWATLKGNPVDVVHVHGNPFYLFRSKARAAVFHYRGPAMSGSPMYDRALSHADVILCVSDYIRQEVTRAVKYPPKKIKAVYSGVDWSIFAEADRARGRAAWHIPEGQVVLLYAGRVVPEKGLLFLVEALRRIVEAGHSNILLLVAGSARLGTASDLSDSSVEQKYPEFVAYERLVRQSSTGLPVRFLGDLSQADMPLVYRASDIFVWPCTYPEPFARVIMEAMAAGLPVVATAVGGNPEAVKQRQNGMLVPPGDSLSLAEALIPLIADGNLRCQLGRTSQEMARQLDRRVIAKQVEHIYRSILE